MIALPLAEIAEIVGGTLYDVTDSSVAVTGNVEFDSRRIGAGDLFVALPGAHTDGHEHASAAISAGAVAVLAARPVGVPAIVAAVSPDGTPSRAVALEADTDGAGAAVLAALASLARVVAQRLTAAGCAIVAVTGSSGKTSTKDLIAATLADLGPVVAPPGSFNNELGHPWTVLRADETTRFLVLELSARAPGNIAALAEIAPPRIGAVLNVGTAHLGEFGSREAIARTKGELVEALPDAAHGGVAILNADDAGVSAMAERTRAKVIRVGLAADAQVRAEDVSCDEQARARFTLVTPAGRTPVRLAVHGAHQVGNALTAAAIALECGVQPAAVAAALSAATAVSARRMDVRVRADGLTVINDSYNANPDSVRAALRALVTMACGADPGSGRRSWAVLGEMGELGAESVACHDEIGRHAVRLGVDRLVVIGVGRPSHALHQGAVLEGSFGGEAVLVNDVAAARALLDAELEPTDVVLVKASRSQRLWTVAEHLLAGAREALA